MENLEKQLDKQDAAIIRNYLLDRLDNEEAVAEIDEKILTEPGFFDAVLLVEQEILEELVAGRLSVEERARAERIYRLPANREKLDFAAALFKAAEKKRRAETISAEENLLPNVQPSSPETSVNWFNWRRLIPVTVGFIIIVGICLFVWQLFPGKRAAYERELARLNREEASQPENIEKFRRILLQADSGRNAVLMPKAPISGGNEIISFQLGLINNASESYKATFLDEQGNEMFSVSNIKSQRKPDGTYVNVLVPSNFLYPGDFQINLQGQTAAGNSIRGGNFTFRVVQQ
jgi:hypothetical protein